MTSGLLLFGYEVDMKIGIFDSGIGGVSVLNEALHKLPNENYIFYADVDHVPYGLKTPEEIIGFTDSIVQELLSQGVDALVIACNTATSVAADYLRDKYDVPIIGMEPAVKPAVEASKSSGRVLVMATPVTIRENKLRSLLQKVDTDHMVDLLPMPGLVRFAESETFDGPEVEAYIDEQLAIFDRSLYSEVVLGCTHFNYFKPAIKAAFDGTTKQTIEMIDGNVGTINHLAERLGLEIDETSYVNFADANVTYLESGRIVPDGRPKDKYNRLHLRLEEVRAF